VDGGVKMGEIGRFEIPNGMDPGGRSTKREGFYEAAAGSS
jgi:hypothetical protein